MYAVNSMLCLELQVSLLRFQKWIEVTRSAPISARPDGTLYRTPSRNAFYKAKGISRHDFLQDNNRACPPDSKRNPGRHGALIDHVIELGSMYHMFEPMDFSTWSIDETPLEATLATKDGKSSFCMYIRKR